MSKLETQIRWQDKVCIISLIGDAGIVEAEELDETLKQIPHQSAQAVIFDLAKLHLISSMAITVMIQFRKEISRNTSLAIVVVLGHVRDSLVRSRVIELFDHYDTIDEAFNHFN